MFFFLEKCAVKQDVSVLTCLERVGERERERAVVGWGAADVARLSWLAEITEGDFLHESRASVAHSISRMEMGIIFVCPVTL